MMYRKRNTTSRLRHKLTLQQEVRTPDDVGGYTRTWSDVADLWAEIMPLTGNERLLGPQLQSEVTHKILLRYRDGITAGMRLVFENRALNIRYVTNVAENNELIELLADEGVAS